MTFSGCATGIGSLPFTDPAPALDLIFSCCPQIPFWPQLPKRGQAESMVAQFSENLPCIRFTGEGMAFDPTDQDAQMEKFYDRLIAQDTQYFAISERFAPGLWAFKRRLEEKGAGEACALKLHVTGPFTFAASVNDSRGVPLLHDEVMMQAIVKGLIMKAAWQIALFKGFGKKIVVFIDEPFLTSFGSAFTALQRDGVVSVLSEFCTALASEDVSVGVHCCGNTDWSLFTASEGLSIINFDAFEFLDRLILYSAELQGFLARGGYLCWGIVPTQMREKGQGLTPEILMERIAGGMRQMAARGIDGKLLRERLMVSPACGLGNQDIHGAESAFALLNGLSRLLRHPA